MRYAESREDPELAKQHAETTLLDIREFLKRSARKEMITRAFMKYGPQRIAAVAAILIMLVLSGFYWYNADQKKNIRVIEKVKSQSQTLIESEEVDLPSKAIYLLLQERHDSGTIMHYLGSLELKNRVKLANEVYDQILAFNKTQEMPLKSSLVHMINRDLTSHDSSLLPEIRLAQTNRFLILLAMDNYFMPDDIKQVLLSTMTAGASNDIQRAVEIARSMVSEFGMSPLGPIYLGDPRTEQLSQGLLDRVEEAVNTIINTQLAKACDVVTTRQQSIARLVELLLEHDTVEADGIERCFAANETNPAPGKQPIEFQPQPALTSQPATI